MNERKVAVITGSRRGIGLAIAKALGREGYRIILSSTASSETARNVVDELKNEKIKVDYIKCDIFNSEDREVLFKLVDDRFGRLDILVNNAGVAPEQRLDVLETTEDSFDRVMDINLKGTFFMCQKAANYMIELVNKNLFDYKPKIINISSISAYTSSTERGEYCISKAGVSMVTKLFADRLAQFCIPVFEIRPGIILTDMTQGVKDKYEKLIDHGLTPFKRMGNVDDVANCVLAACSGLLDFSTGQILNADGGFHIRRL